MNYPQVKSKNRHQNKTASHYVSKMLTFATADVLNDGSVRFFYIYINKLLLILNG